MYKETVSPPKEHLINILNQIPEKKKVPVESSVDAIQTIINTGRAHSPAAATRSPYIWIHMAELVTLCSLLFAVYPSYKDAQMAQSNPFYQVDNEVSQFEDQIDADDLQIADQDALLL
jgi:hypothetical protein